MLHRNPLEIHEECVFPGERGKEEGEEGEEGGGGREKWLAEREGVLQFQRLTMLLSLFSK